MLVGSKRKGKAMVVVRVIRLVDGASYTLVGVDAADIEATLVEDHGAEWASVVRTEPATV